VEACTPSQSFSELGAGTLSKTTELVATVTCAGGKDIVVKIDGEPVVTQTIGTNATQPVKLEVPAITDGTPKLTVELGGETVFSRDWSVKPLGSDDIKGQETDSVSFKEWRAMAVDVENEITAAKVRMYLKRLQYQMQPGTNIIVEIRNDNGGNPGDVLSSVSRPFNVTTLTDNWISFDFDQKLSPGRYWIVLKIQQTQNAGLLSDVMQVHYVPVDKQASGNDYTREMILSVDTKTGVASETQWQPLSYDRIYSIVLTSSK
jgi:hypothetical protein